MFITPEKCKRYTGFTRNNTMVCFSRWDRIMNENGTIACKRYRGRRELHALLVARRPYH